MCVCNPEYVNFIHLKFEIAVSDPDECSSNPCKNNGTCTDDVNKYKCKCVPGYEGPNCGKSMYNFLTITSKS